MNTATEALGRLLTELSAASTREQELKVGKDAAYLERNRCVALIARMALAMGLKAGRAVTAIEGWSEDWHGCVYVELPTGQVSWHFHNSQLSMFAFLPPYNTVWDGHDTAEKCRRTANAFPRVVRHDHL